VTTHTAEFLAWLSERPRSYTETLEVWHSHCPRFTTWEDAVADGLVRVDGKLVVVTETGRATL
jgi:hypothetical protein